jgi:hypothetical protein
MDSSLGGLRLRNGLEGEERRSVRAAIPSLERHVGPVGRPGSARVVEEAFPERRQLACVRTIDGDGDLLRSIHALASLPPSSGGSDRRGPSTNGRGDIHGLPVFDDSIVTDLSEVPPEFLAAVRADAERLIASRESQHTD